MEKNGGTRCNVLVSFEIRVLVGELGGLFSCLSFVQRTSTVRFKVGVQRLGFCAVVIDGMTEVGDPRGVTEL